MPRAVGPLAIATSLGRAALSLRRQWQEVPARHRARLQVLARKSVGRPSALDPAERQELAALLREIEAGKLIRQAAAEATFAPRGFRR